MNYTNFRNLFEDALRQQSTESIRTSDPRPAGLRSGRGESGASRALGQGNAATFSENHNDAIDHRQLANAVRKSPYLVAQRHRFRVMFGEAAQLNGVGNKGPGAEGPVVQRSIRVGAKYYQSDEFGELARLISDAVCNNLGTRLTDDQIIHRLREIETAAKEFDHQDDVATGVVSRERYNLSTLLAAVESGADLWEIVSELLAQDFEALRNRATTEKIWKAAQGKPIEAELTAILVT